MNDPAQPGPMGMQVQLPPEAEVGVFADFASVWHTPTTFVIDFLSVKQPPIPKPNDAPPGFPDTMLTVKVASRVRITAEQVMPIINALQEQFNQWLAETGKTEVPPPWLPPVSSEDPPPG